MEIETGAPIPPSFQATTPSYQNAPGQQPTNIPDTQQREGSINPDDIYIADKSYLSFTTAFVVACFVSVCCGWIVGLIAVCLAAFGYSRAKDGKQSSAKNLLTASFVASLVGFILGLILLVCIIVMRRNQNSKD